SPVNPPPFVAIVILNWNTGFYLQQFLPSVLATTYLQKKVYVIDNNSTDDSVAIVREHFPSVELIRMEKNIGFASAYNYAVTHIQADYFLLVNSDIQPTPAFIEPAIELMEANRAIGICQP